jgi:hypothetical protein
MVEAIAVAILLLVVGDCLSTFVYHVPEHVFLLEVLLGEHSVQGASSCLLRLSPPHRRDGRSGCKDYFQADFLDPNISFTTRTPALKPDSPVFPPADRASA